MTCSAATGRAGGSLIGGGEIVTRVYGPQPVRATAQRALGIDPRTTLTRLDGRRLPRLNDPTPIAELV